LQCWLCLRLGAQTLNRAAEQRLLWSVQQNLVQDGDGDCLRSGMDEWMTYPSAHPRLC